MNDGQIADLLQCIAVTVPQATSDMVKKEDLLHLEHKLNDGFAGIGDTIEPINEQHADISDSVDLSNKSLSYTDKI